MTTWSWGTGYNCFSFSHVKCIFIAFSFILNENSSAYTSNLSRSVIDVNHEQLPERHWKLLFLCITDALGYQSRLGLNCAGLSTSPK